MPIAADRGPGRHAPRRKCDPPGATAISWQLRAGFPGRGRQWPPCRAACACCGRRRVPVRTVARSWALAPRRRPRVVLANIRALATLLAEQAHRSNLDVVRQGLAHVVD